MSASTETNPYMDFKLVGPNEEDAASEGLIPTRPSTLLPDMSDAIDLTLSHTAPNNPLILAYTNLNPTSNVTALHSSPAMMKLWNRLLQCNLQEENSGLQASDYAVVQATSPFYMRFPTRPCVWFIALPGCLGKVLPSDETRLKSGVALHLEDSSISTYLPVAEYPINFIRLREPIRRDKGYVVYRFTSDLFSCFRTPQLEKAPTNLIAIPEYHAHSKADHLISKEATLHQQVLEEDYALPPLRIWDNDWSPLCVETLKNMIWSEEMDMINETGQSEKGGQKASDNVG
ncbi:hypothetical protein PILCRDRAFT_4802 [Piloderma croceum F 1598]|uniref:Uncharacterized protein n=1 Tax=Piloderma croceum (strain F 1598) TaxID=765440 RepID=A0A0C3C9A5_PILCF|nr:hypothetical protein PILCRDRAFT_4802 [Piloderma croceum F 1598]